MISFLRLSSSLLRSLAIGASHTTTTWVAMVDAGAGIFAAAARGMSASGFPLREPLSRAVIATHPRSVLALDCASTEFFKDGKYETKKALVYIATVATEQQLPDDNVERIAGIKEQHCN